MGSGCHHIWNYLHAPPTCLRCGTVQTGVPGGMRGVWVVVNGPRGPYWYLAAAVQEQYVYDVWHMYEKKRYRVHITGSPGQRPDIPAVPFSAERSE